MNKSELYAVWGVVPSKKDEDQNFWTRIGTGFSNRDGSVNIKFNFIPSNPETTVQLRKIEESSERNTSQSGLGESL